MHISSLLADSFVRMQLQGRGGGKYFLLEREVAEIDAGTMQITNHLDLPQELATELCTNQPLAGGLVGWNSVLSPDGLSGGPEETCDEFLVLVMQDGTVVGADSQGCMRKPLSCGSLALASVLFNGQVFCGISTGGKLISFIVSLQPVGQDERLLSITETANLDLPEPLAKAARLGVGHIVASESLPAVSASMFWVAAGLDIAVYCVTDAGACQCVRHMPSVALANISSITCAQSTNDCLAADCAGNISLLSSSGVCLRRMQRPSTSKADASTSTSKRGAKRGRNTNASAPIDKQLMPSVHGLPSGCFVVLGNEVSLISHELGDVCGTSTIPITREENSESLNFFVHGKRLIVTPKSSVSGRGQASVWVVDSGDALSGGLASALRAHVNASKQTTGSELVREFAFVKVEPSCDASKCVAVDVSSVEADSLPSVNSRLAVSECDVPALVTSSGIEDSDITDKVVSPQEKIIKTASDSDDVAAVCSALQLCAFLPENELADAIEAAMGGLSNDCLSKFAKKELFDSHNFNSNNVIASPSAKKRDQHKPSLNHTDQAEAGRRVVMHLVMHRQFVHNALVTELARIPRRFVMRALRYCRGLLAGAIEPSSSADRVPSVGRAAQWATAFVDVLGPAAAQTDEVRKVFLGVQRATNLQSLIASAMLPLYGVVTHLRRGGALPSIDMEVDSSDEENVDVKV